MALTTRRLDKIPAIEPQDLSATAEAGIGCDLLRQQLADRGTWLALDPPGLAGRTLGSVVATATAGPLRHGFGAVRDHLLGVTFVTGDGRLVQSGGRGMENPPGFGLPQPFRGGGRPDSSDELMDLLQHQVGDEWVSASPGVGAIRWGGETTVDRLRRLRRTLDGLEVPLTLERAPWAVRAAVGHFGAYREGVGPLVAGLRRTFDPGEAFVVAVQGTE